MQKLGEIASQASKVLVTSGLLLHVSPTPVGNAGVTFQDELAHEVRRIISKTCKSLVGSHDNLVIEYNPNDSRLEVCDWPDASLPEYPLGKSEVALGSCDIAIDSSILCDLGNNPSPYKCLIYDEEFYLGNGSCDIFQSKIRHDFLDELRNQ